MRLFQNSDPEPNFNKIAVASFILHLVFILIAVIPVSHKKRDIKSYYVNLVAPAAVRSPVRQRADVSSKVKVRSKRIPPKKNIKARPKAKVSLKSDKVSSLIGHKLKEKQREKEEKARRLADIKERLKEEAEYVPVAEAAPEAETASEAETAPEAETAAPQASNLYAGIGEFDARLLYEARIFEYIRGHWNIPKIDIEDLVAAFDVIVNIVDGEWRIISFKPIESSGNRIFDRSAIMAMQDAMESTKYVPLPEPPLEMYNEVINEGIGINFYDEE